MQTLHIIQIRKAALDNLAAMKRLADANRETLGFVLRPVLAEGIATGWMLVAVAGHEVVGFTHDRHCRTPQTTLYELCVAEPFRRQGIGTQLIQALHTESKAQGKAGICLKAPAGISALDFYRRIGFVWAIRGFTWDCSTFRPLTKTVERALG